MSLSGTHIAGDTGHVDDHNLIDAAVTALNTDVTSLQSDVAGLQSGKLAVAAAAATYVPLAGGTLTGDLVVPDEAYGVGWNGSLEAPTKNAVYDKVQTLAAGGAYTLTYDTTGAVDGGTLLQAAVDAGHRLIIIPEGVFYANSPVFLDYEDGNASTKIIADGVVFKAGTGLPTVAEFETFASSHSVLTGCKWFLFPSTLRAALSGGVVTTTSNFVTGTSTFPVTRVPVSPHLVVDGGTWNASDITNYNAGFVYGNRGGATELRSVHMNSARTLLSWNDYVDGNKMINCSGWGATSMTATNDSWLFYQTNSGDGVYVQGCKTDNYIGTANLSYCNGGLITSTVGGSYKFYRCHGITVISSHQEQASNISVTLRRAYDIQDSDVTIIGALDYTSDDISTTGLVYLNDSGTEGTHSKVSIENYNPRHWITTSDPTAGYAIYINKMANASRIRVRSSGHTQSVAGTYYFTWGRTGLSIAGNATNEPTLAAAVTTGRDLIASGDFDIVKYGTSVVPTGQDQAIPIVVRAIGPMAGVQVTRVHSVPTFYDIEVTGYGTGTLTNAQLYTYAAAVCNTLPDGTLQYGAATASFSNTPNAAGINGMEIYTPTAAHGATLVVWRKTGSGVITAPDRYVLIPIQAATTRLLDTGVNINKLPWVTTSVPVPNTVAATNHTVQSLYLGTGTVGLPDQSGSSGKYLTTNGTTASWATVSSSANTDDATVALLVDDFLNGSLTAGQVGALGWRFSNGTLTELAGVANHPGIVQIGSTTTANTISGIYLSTASSGVGPILPTDFWDVTFWVRPSSNDTDTKLRIGVMANGTADGTATGAYFEKLFADTNWFRVTRNNAGTTTRTDSGVAVPSTSTWTKLRVRRIDASTLGFTIDAGTEATVTATLPDSPAVLPIVQITGQTTTAKTVDVDRVSVLITGLTR